MGILRGIKVNYEFWFNALKFFVVLFSCALLISFFHYHDNLLLDIENCPVCAFSSSMLAAAVTLLLYLVLISILFETIFDSHLKIINLLGKANLFRGPPETIYL